MFTLYVSGFGETYGAFAGIIVLLDAEVNGELERRHGADTTVGDPHRQRGANPADTTPSDVLSPADTFRPADMVLPSQARVRRRRGHGAGSHACLPRL